MNGYSFYKSPRTAAGQELDPADLPSDEIAIARAAAALYPCTQTREVAVWSGWRFVGRVRKDDDGEA